MFRHSVVGVDGPVKRKAFRQGGQAGYRRFTHHLRIRCHLAKNGLGNVSHDLLRTSSISMPIGLLDEMFASCRNIITIVDVFSF